jgi:hypothetical protein
LPTEEWEGAPGNVQMCGVEAPAGATLREVLADAETGTLPAYPAGCVRSFSYAGGTFASLNARSPEDADQAWLVRPDRPDREPCVAGRRRGGTA